jgi:Ni,Fe-hydrogenase maturation factor
VTVYVFGNPDLPGDTLPIRILPRLQQRFPEATFEFKDPNEEWDVPERLIVIDTVQGIGEVQLFRGLESFSRTPRVSMHDFDALMQLRLLEKIGKLKEVIVIGVPPEGDEAHVLQSVEEALLRQFAPGGTIQEDSA